MSTRRTTLSDRFAALGEPLRAALILALLATLIGVNRAALVTSKTLAAEDTIIQDAEVLFVPDTRLSRMITLGYDQAAADLVWLRTIGYFTAHFAGDRRYRWLEHFINQIIELDPNFRKVYHWAGASVLYGRRFTNENVQLSSLFYAQALERFPDDYEAAYRLGLNYYIELKSDDPEERRRFRETGLSYLEQAANAPDAPANLRSLIASISSKLGKSQLALQYLIDLYLSTEDASQQAAIKSRIDHLRAQGGDSDAALAAERFRADWEATYPYVTSPIFSLIGEPTTRPIGDRPWRVLLPDIDLGDIAN